MIKKNYFKRIKYGISFLTTICLFTISLCSCGSENASPASSSASKTATSSGEKSSSASVPETVQEPYVVPDTPDGEKGSRDNTPVCLIPTASGETVFENEYAHLDASNISEGYIVMKYTGSSDKVKLQITGPTEITYTYSLTTGTPVDEVFPLQCGNGEYTVNVYENVEGTRYSIAFSQVLNVNLTDEFTPFLYPNQYCTFNAKSQAVKQASNLAYSCNDDLEVVSSVYNFMIENIKYDHEEAENVQSGYLPDVDEVLSTRKGICLDYSALMCSMLRSQRIPARMEIGYAGTAYHAWLSTYITDIGWVNGIIEFDGEDWSLMDPTFASNISETDLKDFIGDGKNYTVKFIY